jgi:hypothetical protein
MPFLAEPLDATRPRQLTGAIVFNVAIDTDFPGHVRLEGTTLVVASRCGFSAGVGASGSSRPTAVSLRPRRSRSRTLARAWRWQGLLECGEHGTVAELADAERISRSYVCRVLRVTLLAPDIVERILDGRRMAGLAPLLKPFAVEWEKQREQFRGGSDDLRSRRGTPDNPAVGQPMG